jgi:hypothetical protein
LDLIIEDEGGNRLVESKRGHRVRTPSEEAEIMEEVLDAEVTEAEAINAAKDDKLTTMGKELVQELGWAFC